MTLKHRRKFTRDFKLQVLAEIAAGKSTAQASREHQVHPSLINRWHKELQQQPKRAFPGNGNSSCDEARIADLERMVGRLTMENELLKKALLRLETRSLPRPGNGDK
jgi:transposase